MDKSNSESIKNIGVSLEEATKALSLVGEIPLTEAEAQLASKLKTLAKRK